MNSTKQNYNIKSLYSVKQIMLKTTTSIEENNEDNRKGTLTLFYLATFTNPTEAIYVLQSLQGQLEGFQSRIAILNLWRDESFFSFEGIIDQILGPRWDSDSVPHVTVRTLKV